MQLQLHKRLIIVLLAIGILTIVCSPASGATIKNYTTRRLDIIKKQSDYQYSLTRVKDEYEKCCRTMQKAAHAVDASRARSDRSKAKVSQLQQSLNQRIVFYYKNGLPNIFYIVSSSSGYNNFITKFENMSFMLEKDILLIRKYNVAKKDFMQSNLALQKMVRVQNEQTAFTIQKKVALEQHLLSNTTGDTTLNREIIKMWGSDNVKYAMASLPPSLTGHSYVSRGGKRTAFEFPVCGPHSFIDSFGFPRSGGRRHQGNDIMATKGTPLIACVSGTIERTCPYDHSLGGITIWLRSIDGDLYYYAHLNEIANGIKEGVTVNEGQLIGFVGNTGNAKYTGSHLHFEFHPGGGSAIDPYPLLMMADGQTYKTPIIDISDNARTHNSENPVQESQDKNGTKVDPSPESLDPEKPKEIEQKQDVPDQKTPKQETQQPEPSIEQVPPEQISDDSAQPDDLLSRANGVLSYSSP